MKKRALIKVLAAPEDLEKLGDVFAYLRSKGVAVSQAKNSLGKKDIVLAVLCRSFTTGRPEKDGRSTSVPSRTSAVCRS